MPEEKINILFFSVDRNYAQLLADYLSAQQMSVDVLTDVELALDNFTRNYYHLCLIDNSYSVEQGLSVVRQMRQINPMMPLLVMSTRQDKQDILHGYEAGCDEYIVIPQSAEVITCKIRSWLRRLTSDLQDKVFEFASFRFDTATQMLISPQRTTCLSGKQSEILRLLVENKGKVVERRTILRRVWKDDNIFASRSLNVFITQLRGILSSDPTVEIHSIRGRGYRLTC